MGFLRHWREPQVYAVHTDGLFMGFLLLQKYSETKRKADVKERLLSLPLLSQME